MTFTFAGLPRRTSNDQFSYSLATLLLAVLFGHLVWPTSIGQLPTVTVAPITSTVRNVPSEVILGVDDGMKGQCAVNLRHAVNLHKAVTVSQERLTRRVATLSRERMQEVCSALRFSPGCA